MASSFCIKCGGCLALEQQAAGGGAAACVCNCFASTSVAERRRRIAGLQVGRRVSSVAGCLLQPTRCCNVSALLATRLLQAEASNTCCSLPVAAHLFPNLPKLMCCNPAAFFLFRRRRTARPGLGTRRRRA